MEIIRGVALMFVVIAADISEGSTGRIGLCGGNAEGVTRQRAADIHLAGRGGNVFVVVVSAVEVPLLAEVVVNTHHAKIGRLRECSGLPGNLRC